MRGAKLVLQVKAFAAKPEDLSSIPITHRIKEHQLLKVVL